MQQGRTCSWLHGRCRLGRDDGQGLANAAGPGQLVRRDGRNTYGATPSPSKMISRSYTRGISSARGSRSHEQIQSRRPRLARRRSSPPRARPCVAVSEPRDVQGDKYPFTAQGQSSSRRRTDVRGVGTLGSSSSPYRNASSSSTIIFAEDNASSHDFVSTSRFGRTR